MILVPDQFSLISFSENMSTAQIKRRSGGSSRRPSKRRRVANAPPAMEPETIEVLENSLHSSEDVVDLTCEGSEPAVVDLTSSDSVVIVDEGLQGHREASGESYVLSSDEEEVEDSGMMPTPAFLSSLESSNKARATPGTISCPICLDTYGEIVGSGRLVVSTKCGHLFCSQCIRDCLRKASKCPTCRKKLNYKQYHPIYI